MRDLGQFHFNALLAMLQLPSLARCSGARNLVRSHAAPYTHCEPVPSHLAPNAAPLCSTAPLSFLHRRFVAAGLHPENARPDSVGSMQTILPDRSAAASLQTCRRTAQHCRFGPETCWAWGKSKHRYSEEHAEHHLFSSSGLERLHKQPRCLVTCVPVS